MEIYYNFTRNLLNFTRNNSRIQANTSANNTLEVSQAAVYFQPQESLYGVIKPHVSPLMQKDNWWGDAVNAAKSANININSWTVFFHNSYQVHAHPECAEVRCTGDVSTSALCPANPDVRAFAHALTQDLVQNYGISLLECELLAYSGWGHLHYHAKHGINLGPGGHFLFSLCFCDACKKRAADLGIDCGQLQKSISEKVYASFHTGNPITETPDELKSSTAELQAFSDMRETVVSSLVRELKDAIDIPLSYILMGDPQITGARPETMAQISDSVEILSYTADAKRTESRVVELLPMLQSPDQLIVGLQAYPDASPDAETLIANVQTVQKHGISKFAFYNYGIMPLAALDWVRQAIQTNQ